MFDSPLNALSFREHHRMLDKSRFGFFFLLFSYCKVLQSYLPSQDWWRRVFLFGTVVQVQEVTLQFLQGYMISLSSYTMVQGTSHSQMTLINFWTNCNLAPYLVQFPHRLLGCLDGGQLMKEVMRNRLCYTAVVLLGD